MTERPNATDYRNKGERDAAYWRELCEDLVFSTGTDLDRARIAAMAELARINAEALRGEVADLKASVIAFAGPAAVELAKAHGFPDGHLHPQHYDLLERCGARMDSFARAALGEDGK